MLLLCWIYTVSAGGSQENSLIRTISNRRTAKTGEQRVLFLLLFGEFTFLPSKSSSLSASPRCTVHRILSNLCIIFGLMSQISLVDRLGKCLPSSIYLLRLPPHYLHTNGHCCQDYPHPLHYPCQCFISFLLMICLVLNMTTFLKRFQHFLHTLIIGIHIGRYQSLGWFKCGGGAPGDELY